MPSTPLGVPRRTLECTQSNSGGQSIIQHISQFYLYVYTLIMSPYGLNQDRIITYSYKYLIRKRMYARSSKATPRALRPSSCWSCSRGVSTHSRRARARHRQDTEWLNRAKAAGALEHHAAIWLQNKCSVSVYLCDLLFGGRWRGSL